MKLEKIPPLYDAFKEYQKVYSSLGADYSVTDLIRPPRIVQLFKRYGKLIDKEVRVLDTLSSFRGNAIHDFFRKMLYRIVQQRQTEDYLLETRLWDRINGRKISGAIDCLHKTTLYDFKTCSVWKKIFGQYIDWENQLNLYCFLLYLVNRPVKDIAVIAWYQDWDKLKVFNDKKYPRQEMELIPLNLWDIKTQHKYITDRIELHKSAEFLSDDDLPECTVEDMWAKEDTWAVYKLTKQGKLPGKASRVLKSKTDADKWVAKKKTGEHKIVFRPGERTRCEHWCLVAPYCNQFQNYKEENK